VTLKSKILLVALVTCFLFAGHMLQPKTPSGSHDAPPHQIIINPDPDTVSPGDTSTTIVHTVVIPPNITTPTTVPTNITSPDGTTTTNDGTATVTPNDDGTITVEIPTTVVVKEPEYKFKLVCDVEDIGIGYEIFQYKKFSIDGVIYLDKAGLGISYNVYRGIHVGIEETVSFKSGEFETRVYASIPLAIR